MSTTPNTIDKGPTTRRTKSHESLIAHNPHSRIVESAGEYPTLRYRYRASGFLAFYVPLLIIPWVLTSVLAYHPINRASYFKQSGFTQSDLTLHRRLINALAVINSVASIVTIPIISALIAQAAVVYTQRRRKNQKVSVRQAFALADRGWSNLGILRDSWPPWKATRKDDSRQAPRSGRNGPGSGFLWLAAMFILICGLQQPVREGLQSNGQVLVVTSADNLGARSFNGVSQYRFLGYDPEPDDLSTIPEDVVVQDLTNTLASFTRYEVPPNLWPDVTARNPFERRDFGDSKRLGPWAQPPTDYFVATLPNGTTTRVLRHRALRLNSTIKCTMIDQSSYPVPCGGRSPFTASLNRSQSHLQVCVPGDRGIYPWNVTRNRQKIVEEIFVDVSQPSTDAGNASFTRHCTAQTTRGYFELGNYRNDDIQGPLLDQWVELDPYATDSDYNDWLSALWRSNNTNTPVVRVDDGSWRRPSTEDRVTEIPGWPLQDVDVSWPATPDSNDPNLTMSGPLMTSAVALFGERSVFALADGANDTTASTALAQICQSGRMPFSTFEGRKRYITECKDYGDNPSQGLAAIMSSFIDTTFNDTDNGVRYLSASVFFTNQAMLLQTAAKTEGLTTRPILTAPGQFLQKPELSLAGIIIISVLVIAQLIGLAYLAWYIYQVPTWTDTLDAFTIARLTNSLDKSNIPALGSLSKDDCNRLDSIDGLVGIVETRAEDSATGDSVVTWGKAVELGLGASGVFNRRLAKFRVKRTMVRSVEMDCRCEGCRRRRVDSNSSERS